MEIIADLHIHSKYSRATSKEMDVAHLSDFARLKGIHLLGTGDFTHPLWLLELKENLRPLGRGLYEYNGVRFMLTAEVNNLFYVRGTAHQIHNMIFAPSFEAVEKINAELEKYGDLLSDGRPMLRLEAEKLVKIVLRIDKECMVVPSHAWTPHFSIFGSNSGFDTVEECFRGETKNIFALETGLSSDPAMNWQLSGLDRYSLISNSDAHSPWKLGREANIFDCELDYYEIVDVLKTKDKKRFLYTIEFFPQEGKYHYDGHRNCGACLSPKDTKASKGLCPKCRRPVTVGVMNRVQSLSDRDENFVPLRSIPFKNLIPLVEIIAEVRDKGVTTLGVVNEYKALVQRLGGEFAILLKLSEEELFENLPRRLAEAIIRMRRGEVKISPGYDGEYGKVSIFGAGEEAAAKEEKQMELF